ncbi:MAG: pyridoxal phosphate-dependent aminotransferase [Candidatus Altiarchaeota archaeon]|nr:pyridoxal phosphate-dependent aminotransferase [Candidatus Altiarchaeota archaeon]
MDYSDRVSKLRESATFKYSAMAKREGVINLTIGRTNFDTPGAIKEAAKKALDEGKVHYTPTKGISGLRGKIVEKLRRDNGILDLDEERVIISTGAKQIIFEAVMALIDEGDQVAVPDPSWVSYESIVKLTGGEVIWLPLKAENGFIPDEKFFSVLENSNPKLILLNSPNNPTGAVYPEKVIRRIVDIAERKDSWIISDEIYEKLIYEGEHFSAGSIYPRCIVVNGFSKEYSMTGWRLGYAACSIKELIDKMNLIQGQTVSCATSFVQYGALAAFSEEVCEETERMRDELRKRRDYLMNRLDKMNVVCTKPGGAFYVFPPVGVDDIEFTDRLLERRVAVIPGSPFGPSGKGCVRMSYGAASLEELGEAVDRMEDRG